MRARELYHRVAGLAAARHAEKQRLGHLQGDFVPAEFFDQVEAQVDRSIDAAAAKHPAVFGHKLVGTPTDLGIALAVDIGDPPVRRRLAVVENAGLGEIGNARAGAGNIGSAAVPLSQPWHERRVGCNPVELVPTRGGNEYDIGMLDIFDRAVRRQQKRPGCFYLAPVYGCGPHAKSRLLGFAVQPIPDDAGRVENFDRCDCRGCIAFLQNHDRDIEQALPSGRCFLPVNAVRRRSRFPSHRRSPFFPARWAPKGREPRPRNPG